MDSKMIYTCLPLAESNVPPLLFIDIHPRGGNMVFWLFSLLIFHVNKLLFVENTYRLFFYCVTTKLVERQ